MIPIIEAEVVEKNGWIKKEEFLDLIAVAQSCPGVFAINLSIFIGYRMRKLRGALCTSLGTALPSLLIILAVAMFFHQFQDNPVVAARIGQGCANHTRHVLDSVGLRPAHLGLGRESCLYHHCGGSGWLSLWPIDSTHRGELTVEAYELEIAIENT